MDAGSFSNSVTTYFLPFLQLIILFLQERREGQEMTLESFGEWLNEHHFSDLKLKIDQSQQLQTAIKTLLLDNQNQILNRFTFIDEQLAKISSKIEGFSEFAQLSRPDSFLSDQAIYFLKSMDDPDVMEIFCVIRRGRISQIIKYYASGITPPNDDSRFIEVLDERFAIQDFDDLNALDFIQCDDPFADGGKTYRLTRRGQKFIQVLQPSEHSQ